MRAWSKSHVTVSMAWGMVKTCDDAVWKIQLAHVQQKEAEGPERFLKL
jgi:hypothetical protein